MDNFNDVPGFIKMEALTKDQKAIRQRAVEFRGRYLEAVINLEGKIDAIIINFFGGYSSRKIQYLFHFFWLPHEKFSVKFKTDTLIEIMKIEARTMNHTKAIQFTLNKIFSLRNMVAHNVCTHNVSEGIGFRKPVAKFKPSTKQPDKVWTGEYQTIEISDELKTEIGDQINVMGLFLSKLMGLLSSETTNSEREYKTFIDYVNGMPQHLITSFGVHRLFSN